MPTITNPVKTATIAAAGSLSSAVDMTKYENVSIILPANFEGNQIAFRVSDSLNGTYVPLHSETAEIVLTAAASKCISLIANAPAFRAVRFFKIEARTTAVAEAQTTPAIIKVMLS